MKTLLRIIGLAMILVGPWAWAQGYNNGGYGGTSNSFNSPAFTGTPTLNGNVLGVTANWTPTIGGSSTNPTVTYIQQTGKITYIGNIFLYNFYVGWSAFSGGSGNIVINGLPVTQSSATNFNVGNNCFQFIGINSPGANFYTLGVTMAPGASAFTLLSTTFGSGPVLIATTLIGNTGNLLCQGWGSTV